MEIEAIGNPARWPAIFPPSEIATLDLATQLCQCPDDLGDELIARLRSHWNDRQIAELVVVAAQAHMNNRVGLAALALFGSSSHRAS